MVIIDKDYKFDRGHFKGKGVLYLKESGNLKYLDWFLPRNSDKKISNELLEELSNSVEVTYKEDFKNILKSIKSPISQKLSELLKGKIKSKWTNLSIFNDEMVSFKIPFTTKSGEIKVTRLINSLFKLNNVDFELKDLEDFLEQFRIFTKNSELLTFKILEGDDIVKYYNQSTYSSGSGSLNKSCMRYDHCSDKIKFYQTNSCKMLALFDNYDKLSGRAIIWENCEIYSGGNKLEQTKFIDRIYVSNNKYRSQFFKWAQEMNFIIRKDQRAGSNKRFLVDDEIKELRIVKKRIKLSRNIPHLDTLNRIFLNNLSNYPTF